MVLVVVGAVLFGACGGSDNASTGAGGSGGGVCVPGSTQECVGPGACKGGQACNADGKGYGPCECGGGTGGSAGTGGTGGSGGTAGLGGSAGAAGLDSGTDAASDAPTSNAG